MRLNSSLHGGYLVIRPRRIIVADSQQGAAVSQTAEETTAVWKTPLLGKNESALDLDPLVPGAGIGHGLDDTHVAEAVLEIGMGTTAA
jgi:hypothetical protein